MSPGSMPPGREVSLARRSSLGPMQCPQLLHLLVVLVLEPVPLALELVLVDVERHSGLRDLEAQPQGVLPGVLDQVLLECLLSSIRVVLSLRSTR
jgi:hypothetical protein